MARLYEKIENGDRKKAREKTRERKQKEKQKEEQGQKAEKVLVQQVKVCVWERDTVSAYFFYRSIKMLKGKVDIEIVMLLLCI